MDRSYPTRDQAAAAAMVGREPGDEVFLHDQTCAMRYDHECSCNPEVYRMKPDASWELVRRGRWK